MSSHLLEGLPTSSQLLLCFAAHQEIVPVQIAARPPLSEDPVQAVKALQERGLVAPTDMAMIFQLTPMGYALVDEVKARWPRLHADLRGRLLALLEQAFELTADSPLRAALHAVDRAHFVPEPLRCLADLDRPVPTGINDMTTSAPHAILSILRAVSPKPGEKVLVCGAKGGMTIALSAHMVGEQGAVLGLDWNAETVVHVRQALSRYPALTQRARVDQQDDVTVGLPDEGPFDIVIVNGSIPKIPRPLLDQLRPESGRLLAFLQVPAETGQACYIFRGDGVAGRDELLSRFVFTPIYGRYGWDRIDEA